MHRFRTWERMHPDCDHSNILKLYPPDIMRKCGNVKIEEYSNLRFLYFQFIFQTFRIIISTFPHLSICNVLLQVPRGVGVKFFKDVDEVARLFISKPVGYFFYRYWFFKQQAFGMIHFFFAGNIRKYFCQTSI